jgi:crossover junction endodeoxyribonuclease RuvC
VKGCASCVSLWKRAGTAGEWQGIVTLPKPKKAGYDDGAGPFPPAGGGSLVMAPDGKHGYFGWHTDGQLTTSDGGHTWTPLKGPHGVARANGAAVIVGDQVVLSVVGTCGEDDCPDDLWRTPVGADEWHKLTVPLRKGEGLFDLHARDGVLNGIVLSAAGEALLRSSDAGVSWIRVTPEPTPCAGCVGTCTPYPTGAHATVAACMTGDSWTDLVRISTDGHTWRDLLRPGVGAKHGVNWVVAVDDSTFVVGTVSDVVRADVDRTAPGRVVGLRRGGNPAAIGFATAKVGHLLGDNGRLLRTEDGGRTWTEIAPARSRGGEADRRVSRPGPSGARANVASEQVFGRMETTVRVLGIDPGLTRCGMGVVDGTIGRPLSLIDVGVLRTTSSLPVWERLVTIEKGVDAWLDEHQPDAVAIERIFARSDVSTIMGTAQAAGIAMVCAARRGVPVALHTPSEVKAAVSGNGRADKAQVGLMVTRLLRLDAMPKPADAADALALAITHIWRGGAQNRLEAAVAAQALKVGAHK